MKVSSEIKGRIDLLRKSLSDPNLSYDVREIYKNNLKVFYTSIFNDTVSDYDYRKMLYVLYFLNELDIAYEKLDGKDDDMFKRSEKIEVIIKK